MILLASYHFGQAEAGGTGGEDVWARSTITSLHSLNYTILFAWGHMDALFFYQSIPDLIPVVLWEEGEFKHCSMRNETNYAELEKMENHALGTWQTGTKACMQTDKYLQGIPWWKSFVFLFWDSRPNPLGPQWTLSPEDWDSFSGAPRNHTFLGYSIEQRCQAVEFRSKRIHRALVLAKDPDYLNEKNNVFYGLLLDAAKTLPHEMTQEGNKEFELLSTAGEHALSELPEPGLSSIGKQPQKEWHDILAESKVLLGVGNPVISPSRKCVVCETDASVLRPLSWCSIHQPVSRALAPLTSALLIGTRGSQTTGDTGTPSRTPSSLWRNRMSTTFARGTLRASSQHCTMLPTTPSSGISFQRCADWQSPNGIESLSSATG